jgi:hypothetical protein
VSKSHGWLLLECGIFGVGRAARDSHFPGRFGKGFRFPQKSAHFSIFRETSGFRSQIR